MGTLHCHSDGSVCICLFACIAADGCCLVCMRFYWGVTDISFRCATQWFCICLYYELITTVSPINTCLSSWMVTTFSSCDKLLRPFKEFPLQLSRNKSNQYPWGCRFDPWPHPVGQGSGIAMSCGVGCRRGLDPVLLWLWCRPPAAALIRLLAWEPL